MLSDTNNTGVGGDTDNLERNIQAAKVDALLSLAKKTDSEFRFTFDSVSDFKAAMKTADHPKVTVCLPAESFAIFGAEFELNLNQRQMFFVLRTLEQHVLTAEMEREWMSDIRYEVTVWNGYKGTPKVQFRMHYEDHRVRGEDGGNYVGYKDADGNTVLWD
tara:strand:+ start:321 stop:803 length:483 start_codon:yes stop_codon:yes gene_type:complete